MKQILKLIPIFCIFLYLLCFPQQGIHGVSQGISLCLTSVIPSLLPFILICNVIMQLGVVDAISALLYPVLHPLFHCSHYGSYCIFIGFLCGYPLGAKVTNDLLTEGKISSEEANHIIGFANNSGPGYIQNYLLLSSLNIHENRGYYLSLYYFPILLYGIVSGFLHNVRTSSLHNFTSYGTGKNSVPEVPFNSHTFDKCIADTFRTLSRLCGYIIIFSVVSQFIYQIPILPVGMKSILLMGIEITNGTHFVVENILSDKWKLLLCYTGTILGGASVYMQTKSVCTHLALQPSNYLRSRFLIALISIPYILLTY